MKPKPKRVDEVVWVAIYLSETTAVFSTSTEERGSYEKFKAMWPDKEPARIARCRLVELPAKKRSKP